ncbi:MAG: Bacterial Ig-like domain protein [Candidatus Argoarchaeum ethanivorans]|uniref:Bacterial Ig-like domain protein n=1 Tax=Candidatus Argoarchaeum ethanivorans TaxID=2608793 RepID=A0A811T693_9EURY|nr:MAG: Bacterial Ig-like domain protein [Candidatus Argoarchaeum ethanivorans]
MTKKIKVKGNKGTRNVINGFVILTIVLSVLAASTATVSADGSPTIIAVLPVNESNLVPVTTTINVTFSEAMNEASVEGAFSITPNVVGSFSWAENNMTFTPEANLTYNRQYNLTIAATATNLTGTPLESAYNWGFHTKPSQIGPAITVTADPTSIVADGEANSTLTATALNSGAPITPSIGVIFRIISGPEGAVVIGEWESGGDQGSDTDAEGKANATLRAGTTNGTVVIEASFSGVSNTVTVYLYTLGEKHSLTISSTDGGNVTVPDEGTFTYNASDEVSISATPDAGWQFVNWTGDVDTIADPNANNTTITMNGDYAITANFERITYTLTMAVSGNGTVVPSADEHTYNASEGVSINATPDAGWQFVNWTGDVGTIVNANANETTITMNGNYTITANFEEIVYGVNLSVTPDVQTVAPDVNVTYTLTVKNTGNVNDMFNLVIDDVPENATATLSESVTPQLAPDGTYNVLLNVSSAIEAEYIVNVTATSQGNPSVSDNVTTKTNVTSVPVTVSIGSAECNVSDTVDVPINITGASNIGAMDINITYNASVLNATNVENGTLIDALGGNAIVAHNISVNGIATINISHATYPDTINGIGELFVVTFDAIGIGNSTLDINVTAWTGDEPPQPVAPITVDGYVNVTEGGGLPKDGDMDGDGSITFDDVILLSKHYYFGDTVYADPDVDSSGTVDFDDVILLAKYYYFGDTIYP